jgi:hypothetical protein
MQQNTPESPDDVDRLFARLHAVAPPADLTARIMRALPAEVPRAQPAPDRAPAIPAWRALPWRGIAVVAGLVLAIMSVRLGLLLDDSGAISVLSQIFGDFGSFMSAPGDYLSPLAAELPWFDLIGAVLALALFWFSSAASVDQARERQR